MKYKNFLTYLLNNTKLDRAFMLKHDLVSKQLINLAYNQPSETSLSIVIAIYKELPKKYISSYVRALKDYLNIVRERHERGKAARNGKSTKH